MTNLQPPFKPGKPSPKKAYFNHSSAALKRLWTATTSCVFSASLHIRPADQYSFHIRPRLTNMVKPIKGAATCSQATNTTSSQLSQTLAKIWTKNQESAYKCPQHLCPLTDHQKASKKFGQCCPHPSSAQSILRRRPNGSQDGRWTTIERAH